MVWRQLAATSIVPVVLLACSPTTGRTFNVTMPGRELVQPTSVVVIDQTGLMLSVELPAVNVLPNRANQFRALEGDPAVLIVTWVGGMCDDQTELVFERTPGGFRFVERTDRTGGCRLAGIGRTLAVRFSAPLSPDLVEFVPDRS
jgi:hypothetical protein